MMTADDMQDAERYRMAKTLEGQIVTMEAFKTYGAERLDDALDALIASEDHEREVALAECRTRCLAEWSNVNDPPCHPGDDGWQPCIDCDPFRLFVAVSVR
jgi:hypothetical protein